VITRWLLPVLAYTLFVSVVYGAWPARVAVPGPLRREPACVAAVLSALPPALTKSNQVRVLGCDSRGRGLVVLALGDPAIARNVAVLVPGSDTDLHSLDDPARPQRPLGWARALHDAAGPDTAVVLWVGYPTPEGIGIDAALGRLARDGAAALTTFVSHLRSARTGPPLHLTVIGHSYGAVVVTIAASRLAADDLVLLGSPGARARSVRELHTSARVWAARTAGDWTRLIPRLRIGDLGHGTDPTSAVFGARLLPVDGTSGHSGYFRPGSAALAGLARVISPPGRDPVTAGSPAVLR
jgi:hypothetical protein